jgi:hypothetical protein
VISWITCDFSVPPGSSGSVRSLLFASSARPTAEDCGVPPSGT